MMIGEETETVAQDAKDRRGIRIALFSEKSRFLADLLLRPTSTVPIGAWRAMIIWNGRGLREDRLVALGSDTAPRGRISSRVRRPGGAPRPSKGTVYGRRPDELLRGGRPGASALHGSARAVPQPGRQTGDREPGGGGEGGHLRGFPGQDLSTATSGLSTFALPRAHHGRRQRGYGAYWERSRITARWNRAKEACCSPKSSGGPAISPGSGQGPHRRDGGNQGENSTI